MAVRFSSVRLRFLEEPGYDVRRHRASAHGYLAVARSLPAACRVPRPGDRQAVSDSETSGQKSQPPRLLGLLGYAVRAKETGGRKAIETRSAEPIGIGRMVRRLTSSHFLATGALVMGAFGRKGVPIRSHCRERFEIRRDHALL